MRRRQLTFFVLVALVALLATAFFYRTFLATDEVPNEATFGGVSLTLEYATTSAAREQGLGDRASVPEGTGMLFVFPKDGHYGFWMKDTLVPLDIFWLDAKGQVVSEATNVSPLSYPNVFYSSGPSRYVLETAAGFAIDHKIATGTPLLLKKFPTVTE